MMIAGRDIDRRLLMLAGVLLLLVLVVRVRPLLIDYYQGNQERLSVLEDRLDRYRNLALDEDSLLAIQTEKTAEIAELDRWVFRGNTPSLVGSNIQQILRQIAARSNADIREMSLAQYNNIEGWLMVSQEMSFNIEQQDILPFLDLINNNLPRLFVTELNVSRGRRTFAGGITVTAFSRISTPELTVEAP